MNEVKLVLESTKISIVTSTKKKERNRKGNKSTCGEISNRKLRTVKPPKVTRFE